MPERYLPQLSNQLASIQSEAAELRSQIGRLDGGLSEVEHRRRADRRLGLALVGTLLLVMLGLVVLGAMNRATNTSTNALARDIRSCLDEDGKCYREQQARTSDLLGEPAGPINRVIVLAELCGKETNTEADLVQCIKAGLERDK